MKPADVRAQIASGETGPLYLLEGDDPQSRHELALAFQAVVEEGLQAFNVQAFHGSEALTASARDQMIADVLSAARTLPMMAPRRVLIVHDAERLLSPPRKGRDEEGEPAQEAGRRKGRRALTPAEELERYFEEPEEATTIVFSAGTLDATRRLVKLLRKHAIVVQCGTLDSPADATRWIKAWLQNEGFAIEPQAIPVLLKGTGLSVGAIRAALEKLVLFASGERTITARHVREMVAPQSEPGENFALGKAIWNNNVRAALREVAAQLDTGALPVMVLGQIRAAIVRLQPDARVRRGLDAVFRTDLAIKSSAGEPRHLLERLVIEICVPR